MPFPKHGELECVLCRRFFEEYRDLGQHEEWHTETIYLVNNPCSWGSTSPAIVILGFSKGRTQNKALELMRRGHMSFERVAFFEKDRRVTNLTMRERLRLILIGASILGGNLKNIDRIFKPSELRFHTGSLVRCSLSADNGKGGRTHNMATILSKADEHPLVRKIINVCAKKHLNLLRPGTFVIMIGLSPRYIALCRSTFENLFRMEAGVVNDTAYVVNNIVFAHVTHLSPRLNDDQFTNWIEGKTKEDKMSLFRYAWLFHKANARGF